MSDDVFGESAARAAASHWGYGPDAELALLCISENATYLVTDPDTGDRAVLRLNRPGYHPRKAIESELAWTAALRREGVVRTPASLPTRSGARVAVLSTDRHAVMFTFASGSEPDAAVLGTAMPSVGAIAARLHAHARGWTRPEGFTRFAWDLAAAFGDGCRPGRWGDWRAGATRELSVLETAEASVVSQLNGYGYAPDRFGLIHGDLRAANLLLDEDRVTVIDFDDCGLSWYAYDLAASLSFLEHRADLPELAAGLLAGYRSVGRLTASDLSVLPALIMLRRLQLLAWSASHAQTHMVRSLGPNFAEQTAEVAERYLAGTLLSAVT